MRPLHRNPARDESGAVAATYAIALMGLVVVAGVGYDYTRMVTIDSELQNAADQAALAAATQLDRSTGACARASNAAVSLLRNITLLSNDGSGNAITIPSETACDAAGRIRFYEDKAKTKPATSDGTARFVEVWVNPRRALYAFTPVVAAAFNDRCQTRPREKNISQCLNAAAFAGVGSAICRVPPLMICNPAEPAANTNTMLDFKVEDNFGAGVRLVANDSYTAGAFGFLQTNYGTGASGLLAALGWDVRGGDCVATDGVEIKDGMNASVLDGLNSRFDVKGSGQYCPDINGVAGVCSPSVAVRKDMTRKPNEDVFVVHEGKDTDFDTEAYRPTSANVYPPEKTPRIMGLPRDLCHAWSNNGDCALGRLGNGEWDVNAYWRSAYGTDYPANTIASNAYGATSLKSYPTRYQVYRWEAEKIVRGELSGIAKSAGTGGESAYAQPQAGRALALASAPYGLVPGAGIDRRRITVAVLNCEALKAKYGNSLNNKTLEVPTWIDVFLVEPSQTRKKCRSGKDCNTSYTEMFDVYVEVIERTNLGGDSGEIAQTIRRDVPYLIE